jgi:hypothetical protein
MAAVLKDGWLGWMRGGEIVNNEIDCVYIWELNSGGRLVYLERKPVHTLVWVLLPVLLRRHVEIFILLSVGFNVTVFHSGDIQLSVDIS